VRVAVVLGAVAFVASACGSSTKETVVTTTVQATASSPTLQLTVSTTSLAPATATTPVTLYFLQGDQLAAVRQDIPVTSGVGLAALGALAAGPSGDLATDLPAGTRFSSLTIAGGTARVEVTPALPVGRPAAAQVVYTLTQFPTVRRVVIDGSPPLTRRSDLAGLPAILVDSPGYGDTVTSPLRISGTANTFEATYNYELVAGGKIVAKGFGTATSGTGTRGTFAKTIPFTVAKPVPGRLVMFELSAADGSRIHVRQIPLGLQP
jgi:hypothetical protein